MAIPVHLKTAHEIQECAGAAASKVLPDEVADGLPLPVKADNQMRIIILYYNDKMVRKERLITPPHHAMLLDAATGQVLRFWACTPDELGVKNPPPPIKGDGLDPNMTPDEYWQKMARFLEISVAVWEEYAAAPRAVDGSAKALLGEYAALYAKIANAPLVPYYEAVAGDFLMWLRKAATP